MSEVKKAFTTIINALNIAQQKGAFKLNEAYEVHLSLQTMNKFVIESLEKKDGNQLQTIHENETFDKITI